jgi:FkbM family methyltransferase
MRESLQRWPVVAELQRWFFARFLSGQSFDHAIDAGPAKGFVFPVMLPEDKAIWSGTYERRFAEALAEQVRPGDVCFDIGSYHGFMAGVAAMAGASLVVAFEPVPENLDRIRRLGPLNPGKRIEVEPVAVGAADGVMAMRIMAEPSMGKLAGSTFQADAADCGTISVTVRALDSLVQPTGPWPAPQVMKIDVEGSEMDVLRGAMGVLQRHRPRVLLETHSPELAKQCRSLLAPLGYHFRDLPKPTGANTDPHTGHLVAVAGPMASEAAASSSR